MMFLDPSAVRAGWRFVIDHPGPVAFAALLYAPVFAAQSVWSAEAAVGRPGTAPLAILAALLGLAVFVVSLAAWGRLAFGRGEGAGLFAHRLGMDERRLGVAALLLLVLTFTVVGTAFLALAFMIAALALINVDPDAPAPEGGIDIFALLGAGETAVAVIIIAAFALGSLWFFLRLALAYPSTLEQDRIQVLTAWPLSRGARAGRMLVSVLLVSAPGLVVLAGLNLVSQSVIGAFPASAPSAVEGGTVTASLAGFAVASLVHGAVKIVLIGAPCAVVLCRIYEQVMGEEAAG